MPTDLLLLSGEIDVCAENCISTHFESMVSFDHEQNGLRLGGSILGIAAVTFATFTLVSFTEVRR